MSYGNVLKGKKLQPIICTYQQAQRILGPLALGYPWAEGTIRDLWLRCAPVPDPTVGTPNEKRIISPAHLGEWLSDVLQRQGRPLDESAQIYMKFLGAKEHGVHRPVNPGG